MSFAELELNKPIGEGSFGQVRTRWGLMPTSAASPPARVPVPLALSYMPLEPS